MMPGHVDLVQRHTYDPKMSLLTDTRPALRFEDAGATDVLDTLTVEAVLQIRVNTIAYTTTVRTPGDDEQLARGLLFTEGVITKPEATLSFESIVDPETGITGCLDIQVDPIFLEKELEDRRSSMSSSSCGMCGIREPDEIRMTGKRLQVADDLHFDPTCLPTLFESMRQRQTAFEQSGGCHAAAAFGKDRQRLACYEDIGRHNAVDKVIGALLQNGQNPDGDVLIVSGRMSYEIVFKAYQARIPHLFAVSAPSTLAVEMGQRFGMTIGGFCRDGRATVYAGRQNLVKG